MGSILLAIGGVLTLVGWIWIIVIAFQSGDVVWGIVSIFCGIVALVYAAMHMDKARTPLFVLIGGIVLNIIGSALGGAGAINAP
jgi:hypothetical protein